MKTVFVVSMSETFTWEDEIETNSDKEAKKIATEKWMDGEYSDSDSSSGIGDFNIQTCRITDYNKK